MTTDVSLNVQPSPHVMIVDDEMQIRQMVGLCLEKAGYRVSCAENAERAHQLLECEPFDVIVTDVMMPGEDGIKFLGHVHQILPDLPVIIMTGYAQLQMAVNAIKNGAFDFIHKPFDFEHMHKIVGRAVNYTKLQRMEKNYRAELEETVQRRTSELKGAMAELDCARSALLKAATDKSEFMARISHEMRTPMNGIIGALDLLSGTGLEGSSGEYLAMARQSANDMLEMVNQLLAFGNTFECRGGARYDLVDLPELLGSVFNEFIPSFSRKGLAHELRVDDDVPHKIWTDKEQFQRLVSILINNACKFTSRGGVSVRFSRQLSADGGDELLLSVNDSGIGIPEGMLEHIFEPFVQVDGSLTRQYGGVGLGLSIARQNALLLNGSLWAEHVPEGGSCFKFRMKPMVP